MSHRHVCARHLRTVAGERNDCTVFALGIATGMGYADAHALMESVGRKPGRGGNIHAACRKLGLPRHDPGSRTVSPVTRRMFAYGRDMRVERSRVVGPTVAEVCRTTCLRGRWIIWTRNHAMAVIDGTTYDQLAQSTSRGRVTGIREVVAWIE